MPWSRAFLRFVFGGACSYALAFSVTHVLTRFAGIESRVAYAMAQGLLLPVNFLLNRHFVFQATSEHVFLQSGKYLVVNVFMRFVDWAVFACFVSLLHWPYYIAIFCGLSAAYPLKFLAYRIGVFGSHHAGTTSPSLDTEANSGNPIHTRHGMAGSTGSMGDGTHDTKRLATALAAVVFIGLLVNLAVSATCGIPFPFVHDEFCNVLSADTFAHGRLANPTHPMSRHFESFHIFHAPVYQSKYPPAPAAFMAVGQIVSGQPILGVWLSLALACAGICWMLWPILPARWAVIGALIPLANISLLLRWGHSYWGGAVAMFAAALVSGALVRLHKRIHLADTIAMGAGFVLLANSRPFEGFIFALSIAIIAIIILAKRTGQGEWRRVMLCLVAPMFLIVCLLTAWTFSYNARLTGDMFTFPHQHWENIRPSLHHQALRNYSGSPMFPLAFRLERFWAFFLGPGLCFSAIGLLMSRDIRVVAGLVLFAGVATVVTVTYKAWPHYYAPVIPVLYALVTYGFYRLSQLTYRNIRVGLFLATLGLGWFLTENALLANTELRERARWTDGRQDLIKYLGAVPGKHLVIVRYGPNHNIHYEYVYNSASIDDQNIVWAREMSATEDLELIQYFSNRHAWLLEVETTPRHFAPYPAYTAEDLRHSLEGPPAQLEPSHGVR